MDMHEASRILNMELLGLTPDDFDDDREADDYPPCDYDDDDPSDDHAGGQEYAFTVFYDADTRLEAELIASDILIRVRKTTAQNINHTLIF